MIDFFCILFLLSCAFCNGSPFHSLAGPRGPLMLLQRFLPQRNVSQRSCQGSSKHCNGHPKCSWCCCPRTSWGQSHNHRDYLTGYLSRVPWSQSFLSRSECSCCCNPRTCDSSRTFCFSRVQFKASKWNEHAIAAKEVTAKAAPVFQPALVSMSGQPLWSQRVLLTPLGS